MNPHQPHSREIDNFTKKVYYLLKCFTLGMTMCLHNTYSRVGWNFVHKKITKTEMHENLPHHWNKTQGLWVSRVLSLIDQCRKSIRRAELVRMGGLTVFPEPTLLHTGLVILHIIYTFNHEMIVLLQSVCLFKHSQNYYSIYSHIKQCTYVGTRLMQFNRLQQTTLTM